MNRRDFVSRAAAGFVVVRQGAAAAADKYARIALMAYGIDRLIKNNRPPAPERTIDIMDIGELCADKFKLHQVEMQSNYFPATEMSWLRDYKARLARTRTRIVQINLEFGAGMQLTASEPALRLEMIDLHRVWLEKAAFLGCPRVLINQGTPAAENKQLAIANMKALVALADPKKIKCSCENRGGGRPRPGQPAPSGPPSYVLLTEVLKGGGAYGCCDMLNFPNQEEQLQGMRAMLEITSGLAHTGMRYDLNKAMALTREMGYTGLFSIKASGLPGDPLENTQKIIDGVVANL